jgi:hypothetical protein
MKKIFLLLLIPFFTISQTEFTEVVETDSMKKSVLFSNGLTWITKTFKNANEVIQMKDAESGKIIAKGILNSAPTMMGVRGDGSCWVTITISCKDGKYKYEFTNVYFKYRAGGSYEYDGTPKGGEKKSFNRWREDVTIEIKSMITDLKKAMLKNDEF